MAATRTSNAGQSTAEYLTLRKSYTKLVAYITPQAGDVCGALFEKGYVPPAVLDHVTTQGIPNSEKAQKLVGALMATVELDPNVYHGFISILKSEGPWADSIVEQLEEAFKPEQESLADSDCSSEDSFHSLPDTDVKPKPKLPAKPRFVCPFCKKCTVMQFFSKAGCPMAAVAQAEKGSLFPYLDHSTLSRNEKITLESRLIKDTQTMIGLFAETEDTIIYSLSSRKVNVDRLTNLAVNLVKKVGSKEDIDSLKKTVTVEQVFLLLHPFKSFFHYEIIECIVKRFGSEEDQQLMREYVSKFNQFCERSVFEVPANVFHDSDPRPGDRVFSVKFTPEEHASLRDIVAVRTKLAEILDIEVFALQLCSITEGCVCLRFLIAALVVKKIFPLSQSQLSALQDIHVRVLEGPNSEDLLRLLVHLGAILILIHFFSLTGGQTLRVK